MSQHYLFDHHCDWVCVKWLPWLMQVKAQVAERPRQIAVGGTLSLAIPYEFGIKFDRFRHYVFRVYGCPVDDIGDLALIGRDLMNLYRIEFDGKLGMFTIG